MRFIRIGKKAEDLERQSPTVEVLDDGAANRKRKDSFVRIGRASAFVRIGRRQFPDLDDPKRASAFVRIGKSGSELPTGKSDAELLPAAEESPIEIETTGNDDKNKRKSSSFIRIGRRRAVENDMEKWLPLQQ